MEKNIQADYETLGLNDNASVDEIKLAYRDLVKVWHPDRFTHDPRVQKMAEGKLKEINLAYEKVQLYAVKIRHQQNCSSCTTEIKDKPTETRKRDQEREDPHSKQRQLPKAILSRYWIQKNYIYDTITTRLWLRNTNLWTSRSWSLAVRKIKSCKFGDYNGWRLPTIEELTELRNLAHSNNMSIFFTLDKLGFYDKKFSNNHHKFYGMWYTSSEVNWKEIWFMQGDMTLDWDCKKAPYIGSKLQLIFDVPIWLVLPIIITKNQFMQLKL